MNYVYNVGDRVIVRDDLNYKEFYESVDHEQRNCVTSSMLEFAGKTVTISGAHYGQYTIPGNNCFWIDTMFLGLAEDYSIDEDVQLHGLESLI